MLGWDFPNTCPAHTSVVDGRAARRNGAQRRRSRRSSLRPSGHPLLIASSGATPPETNFSTRKESEKGTTRNEKTRQVSLCELRRVLLFHLAAIVCLATDKSDAQNFPNVLLGVTKRPGSLCVSFTATVLPPRPEGSSKPSQL